MRSLYFVLPGTSRKFGGGGLWAELEAMAVAQKICSAELVTYREREDGVLFLDDLFFNKDLEKSIFIINWGWDIPELLDRLTGYNIVYHAHSSGYDFVLPEYVPIITCSRNTMGYWGQKSPKSGIWYLPNQISDDFFNSGLDRDIDVLIQTRKSSKYLLDELAVALNNKCKVHIVNSYVEDLAELFNRSKIYLYDSTDHWANKKVSEGFGLPPLEAMACGCIVYSSINGGLSDYLDPGFNCRKIGSFSLEYDINKIITSIESFDNYTFDDSFIEEYRFKNVSRRFEKILEDINAFFDFHSGTPRFNKNQRKIAHRNKIKSFASKIFK